MKILAHICCAPDAVYFLKRLREDFKEAHIVGFFYDPNIHPYEEYKLRLLETKRVCQELGIELYEGEYDVESWLSKVKGLEDEPERGKRCAVCFDYRLLRSAEFAKEIGATHLTTTLLMSPKKDLRMLSESGQKVCQEYGVEFLALDYRKGGGTQEMFRLSRELELYHQDYCGCVYGLFKQKKDQSVWDLISYMGRRPGSKEERAFIKEVRLFAESIGIACKEWEFSFINWRPILGKLEVDGKAIPSFVRPYSRSIRGVLKTDPHELVGDTLYYSKGGLRVVFVEPFEDRPIEEFDGVADPTFLVPTEYKEELLHKRVSAQLEVEFTPSESSVLLVGDFNSPRILCIPADTLQDGRGINLDFVCEFMKLSSKKILSGELALLVAGAESLGHVGSKYFQERTERSVVHLGFHPESVHLL